MRQIAIFGAAIIAASLTLSPTADAAAAAPTLDTSFGTNGRVSTDLGNENWVNAIVATSAGVTAVGTMSAHRSRTGVVMRYLDDGTLDPGFGTNGAFRLPRTLGTTGFTGVAAVSDGSYVATGYQGNNVLIAKLTADGHWDSSFSGDGWLRIGLRGYYAGRTFPAIDGAGKIVVATSAFFSDRRAKLDHLPPGFACFAKVIKLNMDGTPGFPKRQMATVRSGDFNRVVAMALDSSNRILLATATYRPHKQRAPAEVWRLSGRGTVDNSFGTLGRRSLTLGPGGVWPVGLNVSGTGKVVVGLEGAIDNGIGVTQLTDRGRYDKTYGGGDGRVRTRCSSRYCSIGGGIPTPAGYLMYGHSTRGKQYDHTYLVRFASDGSGLDATFGTNGEWIKDVFSGYELNLAGAIDPGGRLVLGGEHDSSDKGDAHVMRLNL